MTRKQWGDNSCAIFDGQTNWSLQARQTPPQPDGLIIRHFRHQFDPSKAVPARSQLIAPYSTGRQIGVYKRARHLHSPTNSLGVTRKWWGNDSCAIFDGQTNWSLQARPTPTQPDKLIIRHFRHQFDPSKAAPARSQWLHRIFTINSTRRKPLLPAANRSHHIRRADKSVSTSAPDTYTARQTHYLPFPPSI